MGTAGQRGVQDAKEVACRRLVYINIEIGGKDQRKGIHEASSWSRRSLACAIYLVA